MITADVSPVMLLWRNFQTCVTKIGEMSHQTHASSCCTKIASTSLGSCTYHLSLANQINSKNNYSNGICCSTSRSSWWHIAIQLQHVKRERCAGCDHCGHGGWRASIHCSLQRCRAVLIAGMPSRVGVAPSPCLIPGPSHTPPRLRTLTHR